MDAKNAHSGVHANPSEHAVTDPAHLLPTSANETRWLSICLASVKAGYVHSVFAKTFTGCFFKKPSGLELQVSGRQNGLRCTIETGHAPNAATIKHLLETAVKLAAMSPIASPA